MSLFNTCPEVSGFKLDYVEIWNWGTFDGEVYRLAPQGNNSLLTGANGSGKSTLIDAMLTLMVPLRRQRFYNQSSGVDKKGNSRSEASYFFGNYGQQQEESSGISALKLRDKRSLSVLLATFHDAADKYVTLFQVFYYSGDELKTIYGLSHCALTIAEHFKEFDPKREWCRRLEKELNGSGKKNIILFFDGPVAYRDKMVEIFGMRSEKALSLFNQIVGVKVLDDLNAFIRDNMLEDEYPEEKYQSLRSNFQNLLEAKINIEKTKEQIRQLEPIDALAKEINDIDVRIQELNNLKSVAEYWFTSKAVQLCNDELSRYKEEMLVIEEELTNLDAKRSELDDTRSSIEADIKTDETGRQIKELEKEIGNLTIERDTHKKQFDSYNKIARDVELAEDPDKAAFEANRSAAIAKRYELQNHIENVLGEDIRQVKNAMEKIKSDRTELHNTIKYISEHNNNITGKVVQIRDEIISAIGATIDEIPFIGELIRVKDCEKNWENAIERILHNFALRLIVPEKYYKQVNEYVNNHNLHGRIVYHRYNGVESIRGFEYRQLDDKSLINKIEIKNKSQYCDWLQDKLYKEFNYTCVDSIDEFNSLQEKAVTKEGLIKSVKGKHEKDDRSDIHSKSNYVLGWDNREKIIALKKEYTALCDQEEVKQCELNDLNSRKNDLNECRERLYDLLKVEKFDDIDWQSPTEEIQKKVMLKKQLEGSNDRVKILQKQLDQIIKELEKIRVEHDEQLSILTSIKDKVSNLNSRYNRSVETLGKLDYVDVSEFESNYPELCNIGLDNLENSQKTFFTSISEENNLHERNKSTKTRDCEARIYSFKRPDPAMCNRYKDWISDVNGLTESVDNVGQYQEFLERLKSEGLPKFEVQFNKYIQETLVQNVATFKSALDNWEDNIRETIVLLNQALKEIDFHTYPTTYIQLESTKKHDVDVAEFIKLLRAAIPNFRDVDSTIEGRRMHFEEHIEPLMKRLEDKEWRKKVLDVRGWSTYRAVEINREDNKKYNTYESMGQLSGGEKAQLTYTILGSAIAYQFGFTKHGMDSSFRFIAIDEAFKAQDEEKASYLISLCKQLHLQLLVVTPSDNIHIVENDISFVHYVERRGKRSVVVDMTISEYKKKQDQLLSQKQ